MIVTFKSYIQPCVKTRVFLASKTSLSIADHLHVQATFINRSTCQTYIETLKTPLTHKQPKKWWTKRQTDKQTDRHTNRQTKHSTPAAHAYARGNNGVSRLENADPQKSLNELEALVM